VALNVGRDDERLNTVEVKSALLAPREELADGPHVGFTRVLVPDGGGEEFEEALGGEGTLVGNDCWREGLKGDVPWLVLGD